MTPLNAAAPALDTWTEMSGFQQLRASARSDGGKDALPAVAKQFEAIFTQMMLKSMRDANASMGSDIAGSEQANTYRDMFDQQLSLTLANGRNGIGIAKMLIRQLGGKDKATAAEPALAGPAQGPLLSPAAINNANVRAVLQLGADEGQATPNAVGSLPSLLDAGKDAGGDAPWAGMLD